MLGKRGGIPAADATCSSSFLLVDYRARICFASLIHQNLDRGGDVCQDGNADDSTNHGGKSSGVGSVGIEHLWRKKMRTQCNLSVISSGFASYSSHTIVGTTKSPHARVETWGTMGNHIRGHTRTLPVSTSKREKRLGGALH